MGEHPDKRTNGHYKMGMEQSTRTIADIAHEYSVQIDTLRMKWRRTYPNIPFNKYRTLTPGEIEVLVTDKRRATPNIETLDAVKEQEIAPTTPDVLPNETPEQSANNTPDYGQTAFRLLFGGGILGHAFLILWDAAYLWGKGGLIAGVVVFLVITGSVVLMWKRREDQEANNLLWFVWFLEGIAGFVHKNALYHSGTNAYGAGITELGTACLAVVISLCSMAMSYFYFKTSK